MMKLLAILPVFSAGCFVMTGTTSRTQRVTSTIGDEQEGPIAGLAIAARTAQGEVLLSAHTSRTCKRDHLGIYETRTSSTSAWAAPTIRARRCLASRSRR